MNTRLILGIAPVALIVGSFAACNGQTLDLGQNEGDGGAKTSAPASLLDSGLQTSADATTTPPPPQDDVPDGAAGGPDGDDSCEPGDAAILELPLVPLVDAGDPTATDEETWIGYTEDYQFPESKSDAVKLTFTEEGDGGITGHAIFGSLPLFPPVTDPNVGYPYPTSENDALTGPDVTVLEGFAFTIRNGSLVADRLQATLDEHEIQAQWCTYQRPFLDPSSGSYHCLPYISGSGSPDTCVIDLDSEGLCLPVNCNRWGFCGGFENVCTCTATSCAVAPGNPIIFDMQVSGGNADGSVLLEGATPTTLHLTRQ